MANPILELNRITKEFSGVNALKDVSFSIQKGSIHGLVGENGAGKSTLIKILTGAHDKSGGEIFYQGNKVQNLNPTKSKELGIQAIYQELNIADNLSAAENVYLGDFPINKIGMIDWKAMNDRANNIFKALDLEINPRIKAGNFPIATKQIIEIAKSLSQDVELLIMDEPTSSLSENEIENLLQLVKELQRQGVTIIYISHRMDEIFELCDSLTVLRNGKHIKTMKIGEVDGIDDLVELMIDRKVGSYYNRTDFEIGDDVLNLSKVYIDGLDGEFNINLRKGEVLGIAGLVGSGRTEVAEAIFGARKITHGEVSINKEKVEINNPSDAIKYKIGFVTEDRKGNGLLLDQNVKENISLPNYEKFGKFFINQNKEKKYAEKYKEEMNIKARSINQNIKTLSGGNQQKAIISKWLMKNPNILILDEPVRGIDVGAKSEIFDYIDELAQQGMGIIMISSELSEIVGMSDRVIVMRERSIVGELTGSLIDEDNILKLAFGGSIDE